MAERRMFAKTIIGSDLFLEMPATSQCLYFHLAMRADDEGFVNNPKTIMRSCGFKEDDMNILIARQFIIPFESGIVVIRHWRIHNYIRTDRFKPTKCIEEKANLSVDESNTYQVNSVGIPNGYQMDTQVRLGKDRLDKDSKEYICTKFTKPTIEEIESYCHERKNNVDAIKFYDFYESKGWMVGKNKMKDWKACIRTWEKNTKQPQQETSNPFIKLLMEEQDGTM